MTKLILATECFPYGRGERSFILPELVRLRQHYDITILSHATRQQREEGVCDGLPEGIKVLCPGRPELSGADKIRALFRFLLDKEGRSELREILRSGSDVRERLYQSVAFYAQAVADEKKLCGSGVLSGREQCIYYSFWYTYFCYSMTRVKRRFPAVRMVTRMHGVDLYHERIPGGRQPFRHQMEQKLDAMVFAWEYGADYYGTYVKAAKTDDAKMHVCRLGTERPLRQMPAGGDGCLQLLSCSNAIPLKRIPLIIDGLEQIEDLKIHWTHIGDGEQLQELQRYAGEKLGRKNNIEYTFAGFVRDVPAYYGNHQVDCFITTSKTEGGCPVSIQEAMSCGIPVIGTDVGGITEMIADNGILLSADPDAGEISAAIRKILTQKGSQLQDMKCAACRKWQAEFDSSTVFQDMLTVLRNL